MRLLRTNLVDGDLQLVYIDNPKDTKYAILSHTWVNDQEVLFHHIVSKDRSIQALSGYQKVIGCCQQAQRDGYEYVWIDTCCIDKSSSAELSEAINSMYLWYQEADICYAFLSDVFTSSGDPAHDSAFRGSRWFTRGWTLQELIAPSAVMFYTAYWSPLGNKKDLADVISDITGIERNVLHGASFANICIATKMSWASKRQTTRIEDRAYSLLGIFGVNMPTIYGEGTQAFARLQRGIMELSAAHSLLAWNAYYPYEKESETMDILPSSPDYFELRCKYSGFNYLMDIPYHDFARIWNVEDAATGIHQELNGVRAVLPVFEVPEEYTGYYKRRIDLIAVLACKLTDRRSRQFSLGLALRRVGPPKSNHYVKANPALLVDVDCLVKIGIPWTFKSLFLVTETLDESESPSYLENWYSPPKLFQVKVTTDNLDVLRKFEDLAFVSSEEEFAKFDESLEVPPSVYEKTQDGELLFNLPHEYGIPDMTAITFTYSPRGPDSAEASYPVSVIFMTNVERDVVSVALLCWHLGAEMKSDAGLSNETLYRLKIDDTAVCHKLQCECGLAFQADFVQSDSPQPGTYVFMADLILRSRPDAAEVARLASQQALMPQVAPLAYRKLRSLEWVRCAAGFFPLDALLFATYDIGRPAYIARITRREFTDSYYHSPHESESGLEISAAAFRKYGTVAHRMSCHPEARDKSSTAYEVLAGPADSVRWVQCNGTFDLSALGGASPIPAGIDVVEEALFFARVGREEDSAAFLGVVMEGSLAHFDVGGSTTNGKEYWTNEQATVYEVLVYA